MDNGDVIPGLNEDWSFAGCKLFEWLAGGMAAFIAQLFISRPGHAIPFLFFLWIGVTFGVAAVRRRFPDEERGVMNLFMVSCGFPPPGIPAPAKIQPRWSGGRLYGLSESCLYAQLGLDEVVNKPRAEEK
jgi:hypothetical protein